MCAGWSRVIGWRPLCPDRPAPGPSAEATQNRSAAGGCRGAPPPACDVAGWVVAEILDLGVAHTARVGINLALRADADEDGVATRPLGSDADASEHVLGTNSTGSVPRSMSSTVIAVVGVDRRWVSEV